MRTRRALADPFAQLKMPRIGAAALLPNHPPAVIGALERQILGQQIATKADEARDGVRHACHQIALRQYTGQSGKMCEVQHHDRIISRIASGSPKGPPGTRPCSVINASGSVAKPLMLIGTAKAGWPARARMTKSSSKRAASSNGPAGFGMLAMVRSICPLRASVAENGMRSTDRSVSACADAAVSVLILTLEGEECCELRAACAPVSSTCNGVFSATDKTLVVGGAIAVRMFSHMGCTRGGGCGFRSDRHGVRRLSRLDGRRWAI